jgi:DNA-binding transcriptional ArsR family regulator
MVDLRPSRTPAPALQVRASAGAELLRLLGVVVDVEGSDSYDVGPDRITGLRERLSDGVFDELRTIETFTDNSFHILSLLAADLPEPAGVDELLAELEADLSAGWRLLLSHRVVDDERGDLELAADLADGEEQALATVLGWRAEGCTAEVERLLDVPAEEHGRRVADAVRAARPLWDHLEREAMGAIDRDVAHRQAQLDAGEDVAAIVMEATNGYELSTDPAVKRVVLLPSFWIRPWVVVGRRLDAEVLTTVVADAFLSLPSEAPSPAMLKLFKALADEGRLKLLRRMAAGPISLAEATNELDVAKATAHHHLSILRQAGLVATRGEGRASRYSLRQDPPDAAREALAGYVHPDR